MRCATGVMHLKRTRSRVPEAPLMPHLSFGVVYERPRRHAQDIEVMARFGVRIGPRSVRLARIVQQYRRLNRMIRDALHRKPVGPVNDVTAAGIRTDEEKRLIQLSDRPGPSAHLHNRAVDSRERKACVARVVPDFRTLLSKNPQLLIMRDNLHSTVRASL